MLTISLIGYGTVGRALSLLLLGSNLDFCLNIIDPDPEKRGVFLDLKHGARMQSKKALYFNDDGLIDDSDYIFFTAGVPTKHGASRLSTAETNIVLVQEIFRDKNLKATAKIIAVTNPVDLITRALIEATGLPSSQVVGTGTLLDSSRFSYHLSDLIKQPLADVNGWVLGEHGNSQVVSVSLSTVKGEPIVTNRDVNLEILNTAGSLTRNAAYEIRKTEPGTSIAVSQCVLELFRFFEKGRSPLIPVSVLLNEPHLNWLGVQGPLCMSVPVRINEHGIVLPAPPEITEDELDQLKKSATKLMNYNRYFK